MTDIDFMVYGVFSGTASRVIFLFFTASAGTGEEARQEAYRQQPMLRLHCTQANHNINNCIQGSSAATYAAMCASCSSHCFFSFSFVFFRFCLLSFFLFLSFPLVWNVRSFHYLHVVVVLQGCFASNVTFRVLVQACVQFRICCFVEQFVWKAFGHGLG